MCTCTNVARWMEASCIYIPNSDFESVGWPGEPRYQEVHPNKFHHLCHSQYYNKKSNKMQTLNQTCLNLNYCWGKPPTFAKSVITIYHFMQNEKQNVTTKIQIVCHSICHQEKYMQIILPINI